MYDIPSCPQEIFTSFVGKETEIAMEFTRPVECNTAKEKGLRKLISCSYSILYLFGIKMLSVTEMATCFVISLRCSTLTVGASKN